VLMGIDFGPVSPAWNVTSIVVDSKSSPPAVLGLVVTLLYKVNFDYE
jgi:hypothetical protein